MPIQTCRDVYDAAPAAIDGSLDAADQAAYDEHLAVCPPCVDFDASLRATVAAARIAHRRGYDDPAVATLDLPPGRRTGDG